MSLPPLSILILAIVSCTRLDSTLVASLTLFAVVFLAPQWGQENVAAPARAAFTEPHFLQRRMSYSTHQHLPGTNVGSWYAHTTRGTKK
jgi:hypothetical protein